MLTGWFLTILVKSTAFSCYLFTVDETLVILLQGLDQKNPNDGLPMESVNQKVSENPYIIWKRIGYRYWNRETIVPVINLERSITNIGSH